jgi:mannosyltransferase OCH1-like enzyme
MIPKIVHLTWKTKDIIDSHSPMIVNGVRRLIDMNPDWQVTVYDDNEIDSYLREWLDANDYRLIQDTHIVAKSDIWRLYKIYLEGGMYVDIDRLCNKSLSSFITDDVRWVLPTCRDYDFSHDVMISEPGNPVFFEAIKLYFQRRQEGNTNVYFLGSQTYMHAITHTLFGKVINTDPGIEVFKSMRQEIERIPFIKMFREDPPNETILFDGSKETFDHEALKRSLYNDTGIKHWTGEW